MTAFPTRKGGPGTVTLDQLVRENASLALDVVNILSVVSAEFVFVLE